MADTWLVTLELQERNPQAVIFDSIETGCRLVMSREAYDHAGRPATVTVLTGDLSDTGAQSDDAERVA